jgi:hypothetical protein
MGTDSLVSRSARGVMHQLSEVVHVCAIYLGIGVLVTVVLSATVPSLRAQAGRIHTALVIALRPDGFKNDLFATFGPGADGFFLGDESEAADGKGGRRLPDQRGDPAQPSFSTALQASTDGQAISGMANAQAQALRSYLARKYKIAHSVAGALINTTFVVGREMNLDPQLLLAVIAIESRYNPYAESHVGAQGLMQVMTKVHKEKFEAYSDGPIAALNPIANIRVGSQILRDCIKRRGSVEGGLACYVGATGPSDGGYGAKVLAERRRIALASGVPIRQ